MDKIIELTGQAAKALCSHDDQYLVGADGYVYCTNCSQMLARPQEDCLHFVVEWNEAGNNGICLECEKEVEHEDFL